MSKKLYRSPNQRVLGGVCGGIAEYFDIDPVIVRILFVVSLFGWGASFFVYIIALIIVPKRDLSYQNAYDYSYSGYSAENYSKEGNTENDSNFNQSDYQYQQDDNKVSNKTKSFFGISLIILGAIILVDDFVDILRLEYVFPSLLIIAGIYILSSNKNKENE